MFLIYNTVMFSVVQRRRLLGILRCVGVTGREIFFLIMAEAAILGLIGSLLGFVVGYFAWTVDRCVGDANHQRLLFHPDRQRCDHRAAEPGQRLVARRFLGAFCGGAPRVRSQSNSRGYCASALGFGRPHRACCRI